MSIRDHGVRCMMETTREMEGPLRRRASSIDLFLAPDSVARFRTCQSRVKAPTRDRRNSRDTFVVADDAAPSAITVLCVCRVSSPSSPSFFCVRSFSHFFTFSLAFLLSLYLHLSPFSSVHLSLFFFYILCHTRARARAGDTPLHFVYI